MQQRFAQQQYLVGQERCDFAHSIALNELQVIFCFCSFAKSFQQVKIWWQNRRTKERRREHEERAVAVAASKAKFGL